MEYANLQEVLLTAACQNTQREALSALVDGLVEEEGIALVRIWLRAPGDRCADCRLRSECPDQSECLHLMASGGRSAVDGTVWDGLDGDFSRFPVGNESIGKIGNIGTTGNPALIADISKDRKWIARPEWARAEGLRSFAGRPLMVANRTIGVLAVFTRKVISEEDFRWLRIFANHAASDIANARAYEEIDKLRNQLELENEYLRREIREVAQFSGIVGVSPALQHTLQQVELVAPTEANVLIQGESGTGKELIALSIHERSRRRNRALIKVNCATVPKDLFESEFFGHAKGAFTGAVKERIGRFELADGGTLFLDEVGEIPVDLQSKLLRVLQEGEFERIGDAVTRKVNVRIISATNRDLRVEIEGGRFREDLYYRLGVFPIESPPLRDRPEDIEPLARHFIGAAAERHGITPIGLTRDDLDALRSYRWPGNVRELQNVIERAMIMSAGTNVDFKALLSVGSKPGSSAGAGIVPMADLKSIEKNSIRAALEHCGGKIYGTDGAARLLGMNPTTLSSRMKALGIDKNDTES